MTAKTQGNEYTRALARADAAGIRILGSGHYSDQRAFYLVSSSTEPAQPRIVSVSGPHEHCSCPARRLCMHVAVVRRQLERDAKATAAFMARTSMADVRESYAKAEADKRRDTAPLRRGEFSIFKTA